MEPITQKAQSAEAAVGMMVSRVSCPARLAVLPMGMIAQPCCGLSTVYVQGDFVHWEQLAKIAVAATKRIGGAREDFLLVVANPVGAAAPYVFQERAVLLVVMVATGIGGASPKSAVR